MDITFLESGGIVNYYLIDWEGSIAVATDWIVNSREPKFERTIWIFRKTKTSLFGDLNNWLAGYHAGDNRVVFKNKVSWNFWTFICVPEENEVIVEHESRKYKAPGRGGKDWHWGYRDGRWRKEYD